MLYPGQALDSSAYMVYCYFQWADAATGHTCSHLTMRWPNGSEQVTYTIMQCVLIWLYWKAHDELKFFLSPPTILEITFIGFVGFFFFLLCLFFYFDNVLCNPSWSQAWCVVEAAGLELLIFLPSPLRYWDYIRALTSPVCLCTYTNVHTYTNIHLYHNTDIDEHTVIPEGNSWLWSQNSSGIPV